MTYLPWIPSGNTCLLHSHGPRLPALLIGILGPGSLLLFSKPAVSQRVPGHSPISTKRRASQAAALLSRHGGSVALSLQTVVRCFTTERWRSVSAACHLLTFCRQVWRGCAAGVHLARQPRCAESQLACFLLGNFPWKQSNL